MVKMVEDGAIDFEIRKCGAKSINQITVSVLGIIFRIIDTFPAV